MSPFTRILSPIANRLRISPTSFSRKSSFIFQSSSSYRSFSSITNQTPTTQITTSQSRPDPTPSEVLDKVKQMNEYYEQYIEEYTEEVDDDRVAARSDLRKPREQKRVALTLSSIVEVLRDARALDIVVFSQGGDLPPSEQAEDAAQQLQQEPQPPFTVVCSPMNGRHGRAVAAALSETAKVSEGTGTRRTSKRASGWLVVHISEADTTVHVMEEEARRHFDLESMLSGAEDTVARQNDDAIPDIPPPRVL
ncbi:hypothetical protein PFISCL1PPCAC_22755 [Pristionchus fissidentatus]|uniref:Ribosomal protein n=1 Tax=Pristionchus fissidentatus TaxID=1538716 RepID=A0AAV5WJ50_9BILA|nr:hypothetical protein PFISCL1PPCAC_22755 [Pristionchus fissidentatus]